MTRLVAALGIAALLGTGLTACDALSQGLQSNTNVLARAAGHELTTDQAAGLLAQQSQLPNRPEVVDALANLWIDYTLLSVAMSRDSSLESFDLTPVVRQEIDQLKVYKLRDAAVQPDTAIGDEQLRQLFDEQLPGARVRARQILLNYPDQATQEQRDSVMELAKTLKRRAEEGADFAALARQYSDDRGTADKGGELGWFKQGEMVKPFEEAALAAEAGEITGPVESPYGVHIIEVEEKDLPSFEDMGSSFRTKIVNQRVFTAESTFIAGLEDPADIKIPDDAYDATRELASQPQVRLSSRAQDRALVTYEGGKVTAGEFQEYIQSRPPGFRSQVARGNDRQIEVLLRGLTRIELLVNAADERGLDITDAERDSLLLQARSQVVQAARATKLWPVEPKSDESIGDAIDRNVMARLIGMLAGKEDVLPLGDIAYALRRELGGEVYDPAVGTVVDEVKARQAGSQGRPGAQGGGAVTPPPGNQRAPNAPPDSSGG